MPSIFKDAARRNEEKSRLNTVLGAIEYQHPRSFKANG